MIVRYIVVMKIVIVTLILCFASSSSGNVDPAWLKNWNEAQENRPVTMSSSGRIASENEPGIPFFIHGQVVNPDGTSADGVIVHAYHRDHNGYEFGANDNTLTTWKLQGWVKADEEGRFEFQTIRPAADHLGREGAHIHFTLESIDFGRQWAPTVFLSDDRLVTASQRRRSKEAGEFAWVREVKSAEGVEHIEIKIQLKEKADF